MKLILFGRLPTPGLALPGKRLVNDSDFVRGHGTALAIVVITFVALVIRLYHLDFQSLWRDEVDALLFSQRDLVTHMRMFSATGENGPLFFLLLSGWVGLAGSSEWALRFPSVLAGVAGVPLICALGARLLGPAAGLSSAVLLATSPYHVWYSQEAKMYAALATLSTGATLALLWALGKGRWWRWAVYWVLMSASFYVHLLGVLLIPVHIVIAICWAVEQPKWRRPAMEFCLAIVLLILPYLPLAAWQRSVLMTPPPSPYPAVTAVEATRSLVFAFSWDSAPIGSGMVIVGPLFLIISALCLGMRCRAATPRTRLAMLAGYLLIPPVIVLLLQPRYPVFQDRYLIPSLVPFVILVGLGFGLVWSVNRWVASAAILAVLGLNLASIWYAAHTPIKPDFRGVASLITRDARADDVVLFAAPYNERVFRYYVSSGPRILLPVFTNAGLTPEAVDASIQAQLSGTERVWLVKSELDTYDAQDLIDSSLARHGTRDLSVRFAGVEVFRYEPRPENYSTIACC